jgi:cell division septum initiation protein DivIVA
MKNKIFKTSLFGYSKTDVCNYITKMNEEFSQKFEELTTAHKNERDQLTSQIAKLEEELTKHKDTMTEISKLIVALEEEK